MDSASFDSLTRMVSHALTRRRLGRLVGAGAVASVVVPVLERSPEASAKKRVRGEHNVRGNKAIMCVNGVTTRVPKKKRKKYLKQGATRGECSTPNPTCIPTCPAGSCNISDGCGGTCPGCAAGSICVGGVCTECTISCNGGGCGESLQQALSGGGTVYICPGEYIGHYNLSANVMAYGAGDGDDPAVDTILTALSKTPVISVLAEITATVSSLRIRGGFGPNGGGGVYVNSGSANVTVQDAAIVGNYASYGGGVYLANGQMAITRCEVTGNTAQSGGGGLCSDRTMTVTDTVISGNTSTNRGGGVYTDSNSAVVNLAPSVTVTGNTATNGGGGGLYQNDGLINLNGATVTSNNPDNCQNVTGC
ncbi:MAG: hypothetical protein QM692_03180 [Thermomicrobiales bacterium]